MSIFVLKNLDTENGNNPAFKLNIRRCSTGKLLHFNVGPVIFRKLLNVQDSFVVVLVCYRKKSQSLGLN